MQNAKRHFENTHGINKNVKSICPICNEKYANLRSLHEHMYKKHGLNAKARAKHNFEIKESNLDGPKKKIEIEETNTDPDIAMKSTCPVCSRKYANLNTLYVHMRYKHGLNAKARAKYFKTEE